MASPCITIFTAVRDAGGTGGGMAEVARAVHLGLADRTEIEARFLHGSANAVNLAHNEVVGWGGQGFRHVLGGDGALIHVHGIWTPFEWRGCRAAWKTGTTLVISPHGALEPWAFQYKKWKKRIAWWTYQRRVLRRADLIIVNSQQERAALRDLKLGGPIAVISNGVDISTCPDWVLTGKQSVPREKIILFLARLTPKKGIPDLLLAWSNLADRKGHVLHIHGFGDAAYSRLLQDRIDELAISEHVKLLPALFGEEKWKRYASASAYVLPSYSENFGITVAEALVAGLPVITTKATPWSDLPAERIGWIVENDVAQLGIALTAALSMTEAQREQMADAARKYAAKRFLWPAIVEKYLEAYRWTTNPSANTPAWLDHG